MIKSLNEIKIFVVGGDRMYSSWISKNSVNSIQEADLVIFTGGSDVNPAAYGERQHATTEINKNRDITEAVAFVTAIINKKPILSICRGLN